MFQSSTQCIVDEKRALIRPILVSEKTGMATMGHHITRTILVNTALLAASLIISLILLESTLRLYYFGTLSYSGIAVEDQFWRLDANLGWAPVEGSKGNFSNQLIGFDAHVEFDEKGLRPTANNYKQQDRSILIVGDSTTAGLEVNNNETYAAVLERLLYESGCKYTVYNAGVRGYGTDQAYWRVSSLNSLQPDLVIYMFTKNDFEDNRTIKRGRRIYGKPAYTLDNQGLSIVNRPSRKFEKSYYSYIVYADEGFSIVDGHTKLGNSGWEFIRTFIRNNLAMYYPILNFYNQWVRRDIVATESKVEEHDIQLMGKILQEMKDNTEKFIFTSFSIGIGEKGYTDDFLKLSNQLDIPYIDITDYFIGDGSDYYWKGDGHWNKAGHAMAGLGLFEQLKTSLCY